MHAVLPLSDECVQKCAFQLTGSSCSRTLQVAIVHDSWLKS
jgi:hypothetical protein